MRYRTLTLQCQCGKPSSRIREIGFTADRQLVVHWRCSECKSYVYGLTPLDDCFLICPTEEELAEAEVPAEAVRAQKDSDFLRDLGVKFPEDGDVLPR
jgi:hypothetical protein